MLRSSAARMLVSEASLPSARARMGGPQGPEILVSNIILVNDFQTGPEITGELSTLRGNSCFNCIDMDVSRDFNVLTKIIHAQCWFQCLANIWAFQYIPIFQYRYLTFVHSEIYSDIHSAFFGIRNEIRYCSTCLFAFWIYSFFYWQISF